MSFVSEPENKTIKKTKTIIAITRIKLIKILF